MQVQRELAWLYAHGQARVVACVGGMDPQTRAPGAGRRLPRGGRHARAAARPPGARPPGRLGAARRRARRGRRDARPRLPRGPGVHPRRRAGGAAHAAVLGDHRQGDHRAGAALPEERAAHRHHGERASRTATSSTGRCASRPTTSSTPSSTCCATSKSPGALVFCATREAVKRLHGRLRGARLRGGGAVGRAEPERARPRRCRRCATAGRACAWPPTWRRAGSTCRTSGSSSTPTCRRTAPAMLHRSGRTGRAGKKGVSRAGRALQPPPPGRHPARRLQRPGDLGRRAHGRGDPRARPGAG